MTWKDIAALFEELELELIRSLARNLAAHKRWEEKEGFRWAAWQAEKLRAMRRFRNSNREMAEGYIGRIDGETAAMLEEQFAEGLQDPQGRPEEEVPSFFGIDRTRLETIVSDTRALETRVESAALRMTDDIYRRVIAKAAVISGTGAMTPQQVIDRAVGEFAQRGINCIVYKDGRRVDAAAYAEMAIRTAATRSRIQGEAQRRRAQGIDTVLISQYGACSPTCLPWQGKVYIDDVWGEFGGETYGAVGKSADGDFYPLLSVAVKQGLFHPNCRHTAMTYRKGVTRTPPLMDAAKVSRASALEQRQRAGEREIRRLKRLEASCLDPDTRRKYKAQLQAAQKDMREFVAEHGNILRRDYWREKGRLYSGVTEKAEASRDLFENVLEEYLSTATPGAGSITYDEGYNIGGHTAEIKTAQWLHDNLGGDIVLLNESTVHGQKMPDYLWREHLWDLKTLSGIKAANSAVRHGIKQISGNPGGIILNLENNIFSETELWKIIDKRMGWYVASGNIDILVLSEGRLIAVKRY